MTCKGQVKVKAKLKVIKKQGLKPRVKVVKNSRLKVILSKQGGPA